MKFRAITTASCLAALALGAGMFAFAGCTVTSGTVDDDGGSVDASTNRDSATTNDAGGDAASLTCTTTVARKFIFINANCDSCVQGKCCTELKAGYGTSTPQPTIDDYAECISDCQDPAKRDGGTAEACESDCNEAVKSSDPTIPAKYDAIDNCAATNCLAECQ